MAKKVVIVTGLSIVLATVWAIVRPDRLLRTGAGVAAHHVCSMTFVGGQRPDATFRELVVPMIGDLGGSLLTPHVRHDRIDVTGPFGRLLAAADYTPGYGCRLDLPGNRPLVADAAVHMPRKDGFAPAHIVPPTDPRLAAALDRVFAERPGRAPKRVKAVVVVKDGRVIAERYAPGVDERTPLISFSVAKSFTNAFLGLLAREGRVDVKAPLGAPEWHDGRSAITVENLVRMSSGLDADEAESAFSFVARMEFLHADMAGFAAAQPAKEAPGTRWEYTSADTLLLDRRIGEIVGGGPAGLRAFARRELFDRLGMGDVTMEFDGRGTFVGSTYVYATARDYARFGQLYLDDGVAADGTRLLPEGWVQWSRTSTLGAPYGAGFWTNDGPSDVAKLRVDGGFPKDGFFASGVMGQRIYVVPSAGIVVTRFGYSAPPTYGIEDDVGLIAAAIAAYPR